MRGISTLLKYEQTNVLNVNTLGLSRQPSFDMLLYMRTELIWFSTTITMLDGTLTLYNLKMLCHSYFVYIWFTANIAMFIGTLTMDEFSMILHIRTE